MAECLYRYVPSGQYFALVKVGGKQRRVNLQTSDLATAKRNRDDEREKLQKINQDTIKRTLSEQVKSFLETKELLAHKTQLRYKRVLNALCKYEDKHGPEGRLGDRKLTKIDKSTLERFYPVLVEDTGVGTAKDYLEVLKAFFEHAKEAKVIADNPAATMKETRVEEGKKEEPLPEIEQVKRIIEHIRNEPLSVTGEESADFLSFLAGAGIGNGEAAALLVQDVDWKKNLIHFRLT